MMPMSESLQPKISQRSQERALPAGKAFSVIIPACNAAGSLQFVLEAVLRSTRLPEKVIVVSDGSTDATPALCAAYPCSFVYVNIRRGPMQARFAGIAEAVGSVLIFVDADVCVKPDTFQQILRQFEETDFDAVTGLLSRDPPLERTNFFTAFKNEYMNFVFKKQPAHSRFLYGSIWAIRRESLVYFEPISAPFGSLVADSEMGMRLRRAGKKIWLDHSLEVNHLKIHSFFSLLRNDFVIPFLFSRMLLRYGWKPSVRRGLRFSHASAGQALSNTAAFFGFVCLAAAGAGAPPALKLAAVAWGVVTFYWRVFLWRMVRARGAAFFLATLFFLPLDGAVMFLGMVFGLCSKPVIALQVKIRTWQYLRQLRWGSA